MAGKYEQRLTDQDFINGVIGSASRLKMNMESIIEKYDRDFPDDDLIDLYSMNIVQNGNKSLGFIRKTKPHKFGASKLKYTEKKEALLKLRMNIQPSEFNPNVSMATAREGESVLPKTKNLSHEPSDAETLSSHDEDDVDEDEEEDEEEEEDGGEEEDSMSASYGEEDDETETSAIEIKSLYTESQGRLVADPKPNDKESKGEQAEGLKEDMEDEMYDADEEDFKSDGEGPGSRNTGHSLMKKECKRLSSLAIISTKKISNTRVNHSAFERKSDNFNRTAFSHVDASFENNDASEDDSFVSISSNRSRPAVGSVLTCTKANTSVNDTFLISANISAAPKKSGDLNFDDTFIAKRNSALSSTKKSSNGFDSFESLHTHGLTVKRTSSNLFKERKPNTFASPEKPMPQVVNGKTLPINACGLSEVLQESFSSGSDTSNDDLYHQNSSDTQNLHIAHLPHIDTIHSHSSKPVQVDSKLCPNSRLDICQEVLSKKSLEGNCSDKDDVKRLDITFINDSDEKIWGERPAANSDLKLLSFKSNHKNSPVSSVKPSQMALERHKARRPNESIDAIERLNDGFNYPDALDVSEWRHNAERMPLPEPDVYKRLSQRQVQNKNNVYEENLVSDRKAHRGSELHYFSRGVQRQQSTSQTSGYQTDNSLIPTIGVSEQSSLNVTYLVSGVDNIGSDYHTVPKSCKNLGNQTPTQFNANQSFNMNMPHLRTPLYHNDVSKLKSSPQKPFRFNQQRLMIARKKYKPPVNAGTLLLSQHEKTNQPSQFALTNRNEGTSSRVNQWVKGHMEAQGAERCHFPSCPPKIPSNFLTCLSPSLSCTQVGLDLQGQREAPDCMSQTNRMPIMSRRRRISACDLCHSCQSPPTKLRKTDSFCNERSCHPYYNTVSFIENNCDCQDHGAPSELRPVSSPKRYSFYYTGKCRTETSLTGCNQSACDEEVMSLGLKDSLSSPHQCKPPLLMSSSPCSEGKSSHLLLMNDAEFSQIVLQIVKNVKEYLNTESNIEGGTKNCTNSNNNSSTATTALPQKHQASASSQHDTCMFPDKYIDMFSPSNPHRIDSDEVTSKEQEEESTSLDFKQCLRSFHPRRNQKKHSYSHFPTTNTTSTVTACEKPASQRDLIRARGLCHDPLPSKSETSTLKKNLSSIPRRIPPAPAVTQDCRIPECRETIRSEKLAASTLKPLCLPAASLSHQGREHKENFESRKLSTIEASDVNIFRHPLPFRASTPKPFSSAASQIYLDAAPTGTFEKRNPAANENQDLKPIYAPVPFRSSAPRPYSVSHHGICLNNSMSTIVAPSACGALENVATDYTFSDVSSDSEDDDPDQDISLVM